MAEDFDARIAQTREQLERWRDLKGGLPPIREKLTEQTYLVRRIEACMDEAQAQLAALRSFSLTSLMESLLGRKQQRLDQGQAELAALEAQFEEAQGALNQLEQQVAAVEQELTAVGGADEAYHAACEEKAAAVLERGGEEADKLVRLTRELEAGRTALRATQKAQETGKQLLKHMESLDRAVRNAKTNRVLAGNAIGVVGSVLNNAVASMGPKSAIRYVHDGVQRFHRELGELRLGEHPDDVDLMRIRAELESFQVRLATELSGIAAWDQIATLPQQQEVQAALNHLRTRLAEQTTAVEALHQTRWAAIEQA